MDSKACQKTEQGMRLQRLENLINGNEKSTQANVLSAFIGFIPTKRWKMWETSPVYRSRELKSICRSG